MNKISLIKAGHAVVLAAAMLCMTGCLKNFEDYNRNPNETTDEELERDNYLIGSKLTKLQSLVVPTEEHLNQFAEILAGDSYGGYAEATVDSWETKFSTFNPSVEWMKAPFADVLTETYPSYRGIIKKTDDEVALALAKLFRVAIMHRVTDAYGPIPYTKIVEDKKELLTVPYDTQKEVYDQMFKELNEVLAALDANKELSTEAYGIYDQVYGGDMKKWIKYANSLKLRMAMRLSYVDETTAQTKALEAINGGPIEANADNARLQPELNHLALIWNSWQDHAIGADIICYMNGYKDPRRAKYFTQGATGTEENPIKGYNGLRIGITPGNKSKATTACSRMLITSTDPILWMNAAEVAFLRAEYELRWGDPIAAQNFYESGVKLSFAERGATDVDNYLANSVSTPEAFTDPLGKNSTTMSPSTVTIAWKDDAGFDTNLERIITQKWIAIFPLGNEAWAEYRRTGYPRLLPVVDNKSGGTVDSKYGARRLPYPTQEYDENRANVEDAVTTKLGGPDNCGTRVWWDFRTLN